MGETDSIVEAPAHEALRMWFEADKSRTFTGMGRVLEVSPGTVSSWCRSLEPARPSSVAIMFALEVLTGIPVHGWLTPHDSEWLREVSEGKFVKVFERPRRPTVPDERQMNFEAYWQPNAPQPGEAFDPDAML